MYIHWSNWGAMRISYGIFGAWKRYFCQFSYDLRRLFCAQSILTDGESYKPKTFSSIGWLRMKKKIPSSHAIKRVRMVISKVNFRYNRYFSSSAASCRLVEDIFTRMNDARKKSQRTPGETGGGTFLQLGVSRVPAIRAIRVFYWYEGRGLWS